MKAEEPEMLPEYDFSKGRRGRYASRFAQGFEIDPNSEPKSGGAVFLIERREDGADAICKIDATEPSAVELTEAKAVQRAHELDPTAVIRVKRTGTAALRSNDKPRKL